jgi:hypothetical protein
MAHTWQVRRLFATVHADRLINLVVLGERNVVHLAVLGTQATEKSASFVVPTRLHEPTWRFCNATKHH